MAKYQQRQKGPMRAGVAGLTGLAMAGFLFGIVHAQTGTTGTSPTAAATSQTAAMASSSNDTGTQSTTSTQTIVTRRAHTTTRSS